MNCANGDLNYIDAEAPSTCSILIKMFRELKIEFDRDLSTRLLIGVCTDSRFFAASNAEPSIKDACFLMDRGAEYLKGVLGPILHNQPFKIKKYFIFSL